jgi:hypothetical protein
MEYSILLNKYRSKIDDSNWYFLSVLSLFFYKNMSVIKSKKGFV